MLSVEWLRALGDTMDELDDSSIAKQLVNELHKTSYYFVHAIFIIQQKNSIGCTQLNSTR